MRVPLEEAKRFLEATQMAPRDAEYGIALGNLRRYALDVRDLHTWNGRLRALLKKAMTEQPLNENDHTVSGCWFCRQVKEAGHAEGCDAKNLLDAMVVKRQPEGGGGKAG